MPTHMTKTMTMPTPTRLALALPAALLFAAAGSATAQSDPSLFETVINISGGTALRVPSTILSNTQINLDSGGVLTTGSTAGVVRPGFVRGATPLQLGPDDQSGSNIELNVYSGSINDPLFVNHGAVANLFGVTSTSSITARSGGIIHAHINLPTQSITLQPGGTLVAHAGDYFLVYQEGGHIELLSGTIRSISMHDNSSINMRGGRIVGIGSFPYFAENYSYLYGISIDVSDGFINFGSRTGIPFSIYESTITVSGGNMTAAVESYNTTWNITGGVLDVQRGFYINESSSYGDSFTLAGGRISLLYAIIDPLRFEIIGNEFAFNGNPTTSIPTEAYPYGVFKRGNGSRGVFTATLADGSVLIFADVPGVDFLGPTPSAPDSTFILTPVELPPADLTPITLDSGEGPPGLRAGQHLTLTGSAYLGLHVGLVDATLRLIDGGSAQRGLECARSRIEIDGGSIGDHFHAFMGSEVTLTRGSIGANAIFSMSTLNWHGGTIGQSLRLYSNTLNIRGRDFAVSGVPIAGLVPGEPMVMSPFSGILTGTLADGSPFTLNPYDTGLPTSPSSSPSPTQSILTLTLVTPKCNPADLADTPAGSGVYGQLDGGDIGHFIQAFITGHRDADLADTPPGSGSYGQLDGNDIGAFISAFLAGCDA